MKLSDYVADFIHSRGVSDVFMISGGGCMHLVDSIGAHKGINYYCCLHEQACAMATEGYARVKNNVGACIVTTGPGGTNTLTGVLGCWLDSVPAVFISGQVKREMLTKPGLRQLGDQEFPIVNAVKSMTKFAALVDDPEKIRYMLEKAFYMAKNGRPGPVWLDIPLDVQSANVEPDSLKAFNPEELGGTKAGKDIQLLVKETIELMRSAKRPVLIAGKGIRLAGADKEFLLLASRLRMPVLTSFTGIDLIANNNPYYQGRQGTIGTRAGNFIAQNSDLLLCIGTRLNVRMTGYNFPSFARAAKKIVVDIDAAELGKPTFKPDIPIVSDAKLFINSLLSLLPDEGLEERKPWLDYCRGIRSAYPVVSQADYVEKGQVDLYALIDSLSNAMQENTVLTCANGIVSVVAYQALKIKDGQRAIFNSGCASMGYGLPAAIGASVATGKDVVCLEGDGSLQMNIQELQTLKHYNLPVKLFVINNGGYLSIKETQRNFFNGRFVASDPKSGVTFPDLGKIANAYGLPFTRITSNDGLEAALTAILSSSGPIVCEIMCAPDKGPKTRVVSFTDANGQIKSRPLEDLAPLLPKDELKKAMLIPLYGEK
jgi:acetolactate synthase-1/2/3 large subunit